MKILCCLLVLGSFAAFADNTPPNLEEQVIYARGEGGYHTYRIPALTVTPQGTVLAFCEGRKASAADDGDIDLLVRRSIDGGTTWEPQRVIHEEGGDAPITIGNPCAVVDRHQGVVWLGFCRNNERAFVTSTEDDGRTWTTPIEISESLKGFAFAWRRIAMGPGSGIQLDSQRLLLPVWLNDEVGGTYRAGIAYSDDHGASWHPGGIVPCTVEGCNEAAVTLLGDGRVHMNMRHKGENRATSFSKDAGLTWSEPQIETSLPGPPCQGSVLRVPLGTEQKGSVLLCSNPANKGRSAMTIHASYDDGNTWPVTKVLYTGRAAYSSLASLPDGRGGCLYERGQQGPYEQIVLARFPLTWLPQNENQH